MPTLPLRRQTRSVPLTLRAEPPLRQRGVAPPHVDGVIGAMLGHQARQSRLGRTQTKRPVLADFCTTSSGQHTQKSRRGWQTPFCSTGPPRAHEVDGSFGQGRPQHQPRCRGLALTGQPLVAFPPGGGHRTSSTSTLHETATGAATDAGTTPGLETPPQEPGFQSRKPRHDTLGGQLAR